MMRHWLLPALFATSLLVVLLGLPALSRSNAPPQAGVVAQLVSPGPLSEAHRSLAGSCRNCHTPIAGVTGETCKSCHAATDFGNKQSTQFHASALQCTSCHVEHAGRQSLIRMDHKALFKPGIWSQRPAATTAGGAVTGVLACAGCHSIRDPHLGLFGTRCASCHATDSWRVEGYRHPSTNSRNCSECHRAPPSHYMEHFSMVSQRAAGERATVEQCYACHTTDSFNNIRRRGWYDHH